MIGEARKVKWNEADIKKAFRSASQQGQFFFNNEFAKYKSTLNKKNSSYFLGLVLLNQTRARGVLPSGKIDKFSEIKCSTVTPVCELSVEISWACAILARNGNLVREHINWLSDINKATDCGDKKTVTDLLARPEDSGILSLAFLQMKLGLLNAFDGLDAQKEFRNRVVSEGIGTLAAYLAHHISIRNEGATSVSSMYQRLGKEIEGYEDGSLRQYLTYKLFGIMPKDAYGIARIVQMENKTTVIDLYETLLDVIPVAFSYELVDPDFLDEVVRGLIKNFGDDRRVSKLNDIVSGGLKERIESLENIQELGGITGEADGESAPKFVKEMNGSWREYRDFGDHYVEAADNLIKFELNLRGLSIAGRCGSGYYYALSGGYQWNFYGTLPSYGPQRLEDLAELMAMPGLIGDGLSRSYIKFYGKKDRQSRRDLEGVFAVFAYARLGDLNSAAGLLRDLRGRIQGDIVLRELKILEVLVLTMSGQLDKAIEGVANAVAENEAYAFVLPLAKIFSGKDWSFYKKSSSRESLLVSLGMYCSINEDREQLGFLRDLIDEYLLSMGCRRPSDELAGKSWLSPIERFVFARVLTPYLMDSSSIFESENEVLEERIRICSLLESMDERKSNIYKEEIKEITKGLKLGEAARHIDNSRIYVDEDALVRHVKKVVGDQFERFRALAAASGTLRMEIDEFWGAIQETITSKANLPEKFRKIPENEISDLLLLVISSTKDEFLHHPEYGLDSHISMRIRHGTLAGTIRGVLVEAGLLVSSGDDEDAFDENRYVSYFYENFDKNTADSALSALVKFSDKVNEMLTEIVTELMQIRRDDKNKGLFETFFSVVDFNSLKDYATRAFNLEEFIITCFVVFWQNMEPSLQACRDFFGRDMKDWFGRELIGLQVELVDTLGMAGAKNSGVFFEINNVRTNMQVVLDRISSWFKLRDIKAIDATYTAEQVALVAKDAVDRCHPELNLQIEINDASGVGYVAATMGALYDILFNILDNAASHSGLKEPRVVLDFSYEDGYLRLDATNEIAVQPEEEKVALLDGIRDRIYSQQYSEHIKKEGRSGIFKIGKYAPKKLPVREGIGFSYGADLKFHLFIRMEVIEFQRESDESSAN